MKTSTLLSSILAVSGGFLSIANAATIIDFDYSGVAGTSVQDKSTFALTATDSIDPNLTITEGVNFMSDSVISSTTSGGQANNDFNVQNWGASVNTGATGFSNAVAGLRYVSFTIRANSGYLLNLDGASVNFTAWRNGTGAPEQFGATAIIGTGSTTTSDQIGSVITPYGTPGDIAGGIGNTQTMSFEFSGAAWDGVSDVVEIRLYGWDGGGNLHIQDTTITGADVVAIPEPSSTALLGLGGLALILRRRK